MCGIIIIDKTKEDKDMTITANRTYTVKEWFADKVAQEAGRNITACELFAVIKETEKAVYAMLHIGGTSRKTMWIPKSVLVDTTDEEYDEGMGDGRFPLIINNDYNEVAKMWNELWSDFR
jgi:hypothetical protein